MPARPPSGGRVGEPGVQRAGRFLETPEPHLELYNLPVELGVLTLEVPNPDAQLLAANLCCLPHVRVPPQRVNLRILVRGAASCQAWQRQDAVSRAASGSALRPRTGR